MNLCISVYMEERRSFGVSQGISAIHGVDEFRNWEVCKCKSSIFSLMLHITGLIDVSNYNLDRL